MISLVSVNAHRTKREVQNAAVILFAARHLDGPVWGRTGRNAGQSQGVTGDSTVTGCGNGLNRRKYSTFPSQHILASTSQGEVMPNKFAKSITRLDSIPASIRPYFVSQILGRSVPFVGTVGVWFDELAIGRVRLSLSNRRRVRNHVGTMHAAAITLLAEAASGFALAMSIPDDKTPLIKSLQVRFLKKAEGDLAAVATLSSEAMSRVSSEDRGELIVPVKVTDASGNKPVACEALWAWVPRTSRASRRAL